MIRHFSPAGSPFDRGAELGSTYADQVAGTVDRYRELFRAVAGREVSLSGPGEDALEAIVSLSPALAEEIRGIADGSGQDVTTIAALNARTEVLAALGVVTRGECSTVVSLGRGDPVSVQTWDWHDLLQDDWFLWTIEHADGHRTSTVTEFGIVGKVGVSTRGFGTHFNILHHRTDGGRIGAPVHVLSRAILDSAGDLGGALAMAGSAPVSASSVLTFVGAAGGASSAVSAELSPAGPRFVLPSADGLLLHTNHFLDPVSAAGDLEPRTGPDTFLRYDVLNRALTGRADLGRDEIVATMASHLGLGGAVCCHPEPDAELGSRWATLATVALDVANGTLAVRAGGPCGRDHEDDDWTSPLTGPIE